MKIKSNLFYQCGFAATFAITSMTSFADESPVPSLSDVAIILQQAVEIVLQDSPGRVIAVELEHENGQPVWEVEVIDPDNQKTEFLIDALNGTELSNFSESHDADDDHDVEDEENEDKKDD